MRLAISKIDVSEDDILTCVRRIDPHSPWWLLNKDSCDALQNAFASGEAGDPSEDHNVSGTIANKFYLPDSVWGDNGYASWGWMFKPIHNLSQMMAAAQGYAENPGGLWTESGYFSSIKVMRNCFGRFNFNNGSNSLYKSHAQIYGTAEETVEGYENMYRPVLAESRFRFSLMDGEGGPGSGMAGGNSAYDKYELGKYGSLAGRLDFGFDVDECKCNIHDFGLQNTTEGDHTVHAIMGGTRIDTSLDVDASPGGTYTYTSFLAFSYGGYSATTSYTTISQYGLQTDDAYVDQLVDILNVDEEDIYSEIGGWYARCPYILSGPLYTGSIAMLPVIDKSQDNRGRRRPYPDVIPYTTTLPLIWTGGSRDAGIKRIDGWYSTRYNWLKTSFPYPQTHRPSGQYDWYDAMGGYNSAPIDEYPFHAPQMYADGWGSDGEPNGSLSAINVDVEQGSTVAQSHGYFGSVDFTKTHSHLEGHARSMYSPQAVLKVIIRLSRQQPTNLV